MFDSHFIFFHTKKWAAKFLTKFLDKVLIIKTQSRHSLEYYRRFYEQKGVLMKNILTDCLKSFREKPFPPKVCLNILVAINGLLGCKPSLFESDASLYQ